jgi:hypothetical protein
MNRAYLQMVEIIKTKKGSAWEHVPKELLDEKNDVKSFAFYLIF